MPPDAEKVALHFSWGRVRRALAATARNAISKMKTAACFHCGFATPLHSNPPDGNHLRRNTGACKNIRQGQMAAALRRRRLRDVGLRSRWEAGAYREDRKSNGAKSMHV